MIVCAPGKIVLTGAYAVLEGAPAVVCAVDRFARADASRLAEDATLEARFALGDEAPHCDASELSHEGRKLGLGSSAAVLVASLGAAFARRGASMDDPDVHRRIFRDARAAHTRAQGGGSGADVAASTYGGVLRYELRSDDTPSIAAVALPAGLVLRVFFSGKSARTSDMRARVDAFRARAPRAHREAMDELGTSAEAAARALAADAPRMVSAIRAFGEALERLGDAADVPIVPPEFRELATRAAGEGAWFLPCGAGGGDVGALVGPAAPSSGLALHAARLGMLDLSVSIAPRGVSLLS